MSGPTVATHRPSALKQQNKKHNKLGHKTKGQIRSLSEGMCVYLGSMLMIIKNLDIV